MLLLIISATYAYFSVTVNGNGSKSMITANTPKKHSLSVSTLYDDIHIHVDNNDMKLANVGSYYGAVDKDNRYETDLTTGTHNIIEVSSKGMENIRYSCSGDIKVTLETKEGSMGSVLEKEDVLLYLKGLGLDETLDLSTLKVNNTKVYQTTFEIDGDSSDYLSAIVELINKESYQNYIANKMLNVKIEAENMVCRENGTYKYLVKLNKYVTEKQNGTETNKTVSIFYDDEGIYQKIQNIYLVDYIDTSKAIKTWELGDTNKETKSDEVMGWLEETPNENDSYDLYIGANGPMRAPQDMRYAFYQFTNLKKITGNALDTSEVTNMNNLFYQDTNLTDISALTNWNVQNVTNMKWMFQNCTNLNDVSSLSNWNTMNVTSMYGIFWESGINDVRALQNWNTSKLTDTVNMFNRCRNLTDITSLKNWDVSNVTDMDQMFVGDINLSNIDSLANWDVSEVKNMKSMFQSTLISDLTPLSKWDVSKVTNITYMFSGTQISDITPLANWDVSHVIYMSGTFNDCKNLTDISPIATWDTTSVTDMSRLFNSTKISDLTPIKNWSMSNVTTINYMIAATLVKDLSPIANWDISNVTNIGGFIWGNSVIRDISVMGNWDVSKVTDMNRLFASTNISDFSPIADWNTQSVKSMYAMFNNCPISDLTPLSKWKVSSVTDMGVMFRGCTNLTDISPIGNWDVFNVTNMGDRYYGGMFQDCTGLTKVDLSNWNVPKLESVFVMFAGDTKLTELKLPKAPYNTITGVLEYQAMFGGPSTSPTGNPVTVASVSPDITVYTESSQVKWVTDRLQEALGENNHSTVLTY